MLNYHIGGIFEIFILSALGYFIPYYLIKCNGITIENMIDQLLYRCIKSFSAGIILGVAFLHLLAEASEALSEYAEYPVALAMVLLGFMATLAMEQLAMHTMLSISISSDSSKASYVSSVTQDDHNHNSHNHNSHNHNHDKSNLESLELPELQVQSSELGHHSHEHVHSKQMVPDKDLNKSFVKALVLEAAIACHSIIVGFGVGATKDVPTLEVLLVAIGLHQFFEGIGLGSALLEGKLSMTIIYSFGILFALTAPIGIVLGVYSSKDEETGVLVAGFADSFAAGMLIYTSIVDMIGEDYMDNNFKTRHFGKMCMYFSLALGISVMAILAIWA